MAKQKFVFLVTRNHYDYDSFDGDPVLESVEIVKVFATSKKAYDYYKEVMSHTPYLQITSVEVE